MKTFDFGKFISIILFIAFASVSCWATAESLYFSMQVPLAVCYVISIGFFLVASYGTTLIVNSLNQNSYLKNRSLNLWGGLLITLSFWLICSMPTNTHTFVYRDIASGVTISDVQQTIEYLNQLAENTTQEKIINNKCRELEINVNNAFENLKREIRNKNNPGFGQSAREKLNNLSSALGSNIDELSLRTNSFSNSKEREQLISDYRKIVDDLLTLKLEEIRKRETASNTQSIISGAKVQLAALQKYETSIKDKKFDFQNRDSMTDINEELHSAYSVVKANKGLIYFISKEDAARYTKENPNTKVDSIISVFNVWSDIFKGKFEGKGLWYWIVLSILVDIAAFIFFDIAFAKRNDEFKI